jgi:3',5'-cyclic-AMP phosphodiesterase
MKFIHLSDPHLTPAGLPLHGMDTQARFDACLDDIATHHRNADFCVITGDLTEAGETSTYDWLRTRLARFPIETRLLLGNCDNRANFLSVFGAPNADGFVQSAFRQGDNLLLFLDTLGDGRSAEGRYDEQRLNWLKRQLAKTESPSTFIFMHHPPFNIGHSNDAIKLADDAAFVEALTTFPIRHIFFGHAHRPVSGIWQGIGFTGVPGLSFQIPLVLGSVETDLSEEPPMYGVVSVDPAQVTVHFDAFLHRKALGNFTRC